MDILWHVGHPADEALRAHLRRSLGGDPTEPAISAGRHCPSCGSDAHGRPWVRAGSGHAPFVSLSRCGDHLVTVLADHTVGIDVESIAAVDARWDPDLVLHPSEHSPNAPRPILVRGRGPEGRQEQRAATWCRKEAILKALGTGLRTPMSQIRVANWEVEDVPAPAGLWASVARLPQAGSSGRSTS